MSPSRSPAWVSGHLDQRTNTNTAANPDCPWLFPGQMPGKHMNPQSIVNVLRGAGIPPLAARTGTWLQLVQEAPPSVLAASLGINPATAMRYANLAGADYLAY